MTTNNENYEEILKDIQEIKIEDTEFKDENGKGSEE